MKFNTKPFNTGMFNGGRFSGVMYSTDPVVFDGFSLSDGTSLVLEKPVTGGPPTDVVGGNVPQGDGEYQTAVYGRARILTFPLRAKAASAAAMADLLDTVKLRLGTENGNLDVTEDNGTVKRYVATMIGFDELDTERDYYHLTVCPLRVKFRVPDGFGRSRNYTSDLISFTEADSPYTQVITHAGTAKSRPVVILIFNTASSVTTINIQRIDPSGTTLDEIEYAGAAAANDVFEFDSENQVVKKNGAEVLYTGGFLFLEPGANLLKLTVTGAAFAIDATIKHKTTYR